MPGSVVQKNTWPWSATVLFAALAACGQEDCAFVADSAHYQVTRTLRASLAATELSATVEVVDPAGGAVSTAIAVSSPAAPLPADAMPDRSAMALDQTGYDALKTLLDALVA